MTEGNRNAELEPGARIARLLAVQTGGSSSPALAEAADGERFVVKLAGAGAGPHGLLTEYLAVGAAQAMGLPVPPARPLLLAPGMPWQVGTDEFDDLIQRSVGWNLGIAYLPDARPVRRADLPSLPPDFLATLAAADSLLQNYDRGADNLNLLADAEAVWAIDFGSCLFLNRVLAGPGPYDFRLPPNHFLTAGFLPAFSSTTLPIDAATLARVGSALGQVLDTCPAEWLAAVPLDRTELGGRLQAYVKAYAAAAA